jgi:N6-L-threonylcarbamoyladenine synthase
VTSVLGIETSCDETAAAIVRDGREVLSNVVASQADLHAVFGGVVPEVASRRHTELITGVVEQACRDAGVALPEVDAIAVTHGPGLVGSLLVGVSAAKGYAYALHKPLVAVNHIEAHVYANFLPAERGTPPPEIRSPAVCLVASGGHSDIVLLQAPGSYRILGWTRDDAAGEALDKVARLLGLGWPGGPAMERAAAGGDPTACAFARVWLDNSFDFSFSGLKTAALRIWQSLLPEERDRHVADIAASFQAAVVEALVSHTVAAARGAGARMVLLSGGVAANRTLRREMAAAVAELGVPFHCPPPTLCTDNAAMVAAVGYHMLQRRGPDPLDVDTFSTLPLADHI